MKKQQTQHYKKQNRQKKSGWLLYVVALIFVRVVCGTKLTIKDKQTFQGTYLSIDDGGAEVLFNTENIILNTDHQITFTGYTFESETHADPEILNKLCDSIDAKFYFKDDSESMLLVMNDGSLRLYDNEFNLISILYKISNTFLAEINKTEIFDILLLQKVIIDKIQKNVFNKEFKNLTKNVNDLFMDTNYQRIPILIPEPQRMNLTQSTKLSQPTSQHQLLLIIYFIVLIIAVIFFYFQCCRRQDEPNTEELPHVHDEANDFGIHYPSSTDLVIDVKDTESLDNTETNISLTVSITSVTMETIKTCSALSTPTDSKVQNSNAVELTELKTEESHDSHSQEDEENSNEIHSVDDFTI